jgi:hypothetical protein
MAPRPSWRGYLRLSLVTCPVAMLPATSEAEKVRFHTLMPEMVSAAEGGWRSCTRAAMCSRAVDAAGWPMRANRRTRGIELSANRRRSGCGSAAHRASSSSFRRSRPGCTGGPMVGCSIRPQPHRSAGALWSTTTCVGTIPVFCATRASLGGSPDRGGAALSATRAAVE